MVISGEIAGLAMSVASGVVKLGRRIDEIMAEEEALRSNTALPFPAVAAIPLVSERKSALKKLLDETSGLTPDPLGSDRATISALRSQSGVGNELWKFCKKYGLTDFGLDTFDPDELFKQALLARNAAWNLEELDVRRVTYYVAAGPDRRRASLAFRLGASVLDVLAEFASENARFLVENDSTRSILETILRRFAEPDLSRMDGWGQVVRHALRSTANGLLDSRELLHDNKEWLEHSLNALARARDLSPNGEDFVLGLMRGEGFRHLVRGVLEQSAQVLAREDASVLEEVLSDIVLRAAELSEGAPDFEAFFQDNWHRLLGAGLDALKEHGTILLAEEDPVLQATLTAAVGALADAFDEGPPSGDTLVIVVEAAVGVFADDPALLEGSVGEEWIRDLIGAVAGVLRDEGLLEAFGGPALDRYAREVLSVLALHPQVLVEDNELVQTILSGVLTSMSQADSLGLEVLAEAALTAALSSIAENPGLIAHEYAEVFGELAGKLAARVAEHGLTRVQALDLIEVLAEVLATNEKLFLEAREGLADALLDAVLDAAGENEEGLLTGSLLVSTVAHVFEVVAARGNLPPAGGPLDELRDRVHELLLEALELAADELGKRLSQANLPAVLAALIDAWARGDDVPDPASAEFKTFFAELAETVSSAA